MFRLGEIAARVLLVAGGLTLAALAAFALLQPNGAAGDRPLLQIDFVSGVTMLMLTAAVVVILAGYLKRVWTEPLRAVVEHTRRTADGLEQPAPTSAIEAGELAPTRYLSYVELLDELDPPPLEEQTIGETPDDD